MNKREKLISDLGDQIICSLESFDDYEAEYDDMGLDNASLGGSDVYKYGNAQCDVEYSVLWNRDGVSIECLLYGTKGIHKGRYKTLERIEEAVNQYVVDNLNTDELLSSIEERHRECCEDEWESHGFSDAMDYYSWRYG